MPNIKIELLMTAFQTEIIVPDKQEKVSNFFRVLIPAAILVWLVAFTRVYYTMNGYPAPVLINILLVLSLICLPIIWWYTWFHNTVETKGELHLSDSDIDLHWADPQVQFHYPINEVKNLSLVYDGYAGGSLLNPNKGTQNLIQFTHKGENIALNFRLNSSEAASQMAAVVKSWYERGINIAEKNSKGEERYLMIYGGQHKPALA